MDFLLNPFLVFWILLLLALIFFKLKRQRMIKATALAAVILLFLFSASPLPLIMGRALEQQYPPLTEAYVEKRLPVLVLGSSHTNDPSLPPLQQLSRTALERLSEGIRQYQNTKGGKIVFSGYSRSGQTPQAVVLARAAVSLGVAAKDTLMNVRPHDTWEEAIVFRKRFTPGTKFILVTSAAHMPRAMEVFRRNGLNPVAAPTDFLFKQDTTKTMYNFKPSAEKLYASQKILHEYAGLAYYRWFK
jgi:uncharacterized SAM-binding protein YcdF (DUF218 family)